MMSLFEMICFCGEIIIGAICVCVVGCVLFVLAIAVTAFLTGIIEGIREKLEESKKGD